MHGFGVYSFANGHRYEGSWHEGRRQGFGVYTFRNGETQSGHWQNGILDVPSSKNATCVIDHHRSKVLNAVQVPPASLHLAFVIKLSFASTFSYCMEEGYVDFREFCSL